MCIRDRGPGGLQQGPRGQQVRGDAEVEVPFALGRDRRRQVEDGVDGLGEQRRQELGQVAAGRLDVRHRVEPARLRRELVRQHQGVDRGAAERAAGDQLVGEGRTDEAVPAGDDDAHGLSLIHI